ncbi:MAG: methyltransferase type 11, partial [Candidatus Marinimicrobia bacterium]|nr:methyltransferase type 11 [Candidatus Neomarinimicrobiota bacterium]
MKKNAKGLKLYDSLDLTESENKEKLLDVYQKWASLYDKDNDDELGTVSQPNSVQIFERYVKDKTTNIIDVGCGT